MLRFHDITLGYDRHPAAHHLDWDVPAGSLVALLGPNGGGKSTLLKGIVGELRPLGGRIELAGVERRRIAYLPQQGQIDRGFLIRVGDLVALGLWHRTGAFGGFSAAEGRALAEALAAVGLTGFAGRPIGPLSGGQLQRALFARGCCRTRP